MSSLRNFLRKQPRPVLDQLLNDTTTELCLESSTGERDEQVTERGYQLEREHEAIYGVIIERDIAGHIFTHDSPRDLGQLAKDVLYLLLIIGAGATAISVLI